MGLVAGDPLLAAVGQLAQGVEFGAESVANKSAIAAYQRTLVGQRRVERGAQLVAQVDARLQLRKQLGFAAR